MNQFCISYCLCEFDQAPHSLLKNKENMKFIKESILSQYCTNSLHEIPKVVCNQATNSPPNSVGLGLSKENSIITKMTSAFSPYIPKERSYKDDSSDSPLREITQEDEKEEFKHHAPSEIKSLSKYSLRKDVIYKAIFRSLRKFLINDFKEFFDFTRCVKRFNTETNGELISMIRLYIHQKFDNACDHLELLLLQILCIIDPKQKYCTISPSTQAKYKEALSLFYCYSKRRLSQQLESEELVTLVLHFLAQPNLTEITVRDRNDRQMVTEYEKIFCELRNKCITAKTFK
ncbi:unnamed protein product [Moneuplotes crassus]|uniref:Uncharacterized protein n=1 Tax=Euplotes crassus TaxID=5936 RepID=A0AAD1Y6D2_EUPCR|nr:unnamed protein product [Moneuplotes crassus]